MPAVTVADLRDITAVRARVDLVEQDAVQLQSMPLHARRVIVRLGSASVMAVSMNVRVRSRTIVQPGLVAYVAFGPRASGTVDGLPVRPGMMAAAGPCAEGRFVVDGGWKSVTVLLPPDEVHAHLAARGRAGEFHVPDGVELLQVEDARSRALFAWGERLANVASRHPRAFEFPPERDAARVEMIELLLNALGKAHDLEPSRRDRTRRGYGGIVKIAEDHALARVDDHVYVSDLCKAAAVSERTLENAFREVLGLSPVAYLTRLRLHRVREALLQSAPGTTTVTREASNWGFWHFGEFSRAYRDCFGERPSDTLRRQVT
ncbi:MAG: helix-turn-helix domain-containing protein [Burkholderiales bacterium]